MLIERHGGEHGLGDLDRLVHLILQLLVAAVVAVAARGGKTEAEEGMQKDAEGGNRPAAAVSWLHSEQE